LGLAIDSSLLREALGSAGAQACCWGCRAPPGTYPAAAPAAAPPTTDTVTMTVTQSTPVSCSCPTGLAKVPALKSSRRTRPTYLSIPREAPLALYIRRRCVPSLPPHQRKQRARTSAPPQVIGVAVVAAWTAGIMSCFFALVHYLGLLRVTERQEEMGLDLSYHGGTAYEQLVAEGASGRLAFEHVPRTAHCPFLLTCSSLFTCS